MLGPGTPLGPYKILAPLGAGGMGEVYRAHDTRLGRDVAIKVLSPHLAATPEVRTRFEREARTISQLNHPHICTLYDVGRAGDTDYLVMELLEGETLAHRLEKGPLPVADVLSLGAQIADALDRAHRAGVVHRDLKPANVMLTKSGVKLMDFGLARSHGMAPVAGALSESPTVSRPLTAEGTLVGTFQYMAPEQLEGKEADARSDLWALGCVLYEMATGKRAFEGQSQASLIAAVLERQPRSILELQPLTPPALEHLVRRCLAKDPADRWQSALDLMHELKWIVEAGSQAGVPAAIAARRHGRARLAWGVTVAAVLALLAALMFQWMHRQPPPRLARLSMTGPEGGWMYLDSPSAGISPDGRLVVLTVGDSTGGFRLWIRPLDSSSARPLAGTDNAVQPFWSPDGRYIAFFADGKLRKIPAAGGAPETICDAPDGRGGTWSKDGVIVFAPTTEGPLQRVSSDGGEVIVVAWPDSAHGETGLRFPCFLPDGRHFLYAGLPRKQGEFDVHLGSLDSKEAPRIMTAGSAPVYAEPGYLIFAREDRLVAQRFDRSRLRPTGRVLTLDDQLPPSDTEGSPLLCTPAKGVLLYVTAKIPNTQLVWFDRAGQPIGTVSLPPGRYESPSLSPDDRWAAVLRMSSRNNGDLWLVDLERAMPTRATFNGAASNFPACWSPDGRRIAFVYGPSGRNDIYQVLTGGTGQPEPLVLSGGLFKSPHAWSPDGRYLVFGQLGQATGSDLWLLPLEGKREPVPYLCSSYWEQGADVSPDGRWLAYSSNETGTGEIYVQSFPVPGEKHRISAAGGYEAKWSRDGRELIWASGSIYSVEVRTTPSFSAGTPRRLFTPRPDLAGAAGATATSDLQRFLACVPVEGSAPASLTVILNWEALLTEESE